MRLHCVLRWMGIRRALAAIPLGKPRSRHPVRRAGFRLAYGLIAHRFSPGRGRHHPVHHTTFPSRERRRQRASASRPARVSRRGPQGSVSLRTALARNAAAFCACRRRVPWPKAHDPGSAATHRGQASCAARLRSATGMACRLAARRGKIPRRRTGELLATEIDERAQRQAHGAGGAALQPVYEAVLRILQSVSACLVPPPSRTGVRLHLVRRERAEGQARTVDKGAPLPCMRVNDAKAAMHGVRGRAQQRQVRQGRFRVLGFAQDSALYVDRSVRAYHQGFPLPVLLAPGGQGRAKSVRLARGQPRDHGRSRLARRPVFRHGNGTYDYRPCQGLKQFPATRTGRGQKQRNSEGHAQPADERETAAACSARFCAAGRGTRNPGKACRQV